MTIYYSLTEKEEFKNPVITIGTFDGVHIGHKKIFNCVKQIANEINGDPIIITFSEHPKKVLTPKTPPKILTTSKEKVKAIENLGIKNIIMIPFTLELSQLSALEFLEKIIYYNFGLKHIVIGYDHAFGKNREGNYEMLKSISKEKNFDVTRVNPVLVGSQPVSSSWIRTEIEDGNVVMANKLLGREYSLQGKVVEGQQRGRLLGFPTANILPDDKDKIIPKDGVYAVKVKIHDKYYNGMLNIGTNPTFENTERTIEVNIFDFDEDIYNENIEVYFYERIRDEKKFNSVSDLKLQLNMDKNEALKIFINQGND